MKDDCSILQGAFSVRNLCSELNPEYVHSDSSPLSPFTTDQQIIREYLHTVISLPDAELKSCKELLLPSGLYLRVTRAEIISNLYKSKSLKTCRLIHKEIPPLVSFHRCKKWNKRNKICGYYKKVLS